MKKNYSLINVILWIFLSPALSYAGKASFLGTGRLSANPDYVELQVTVTSECYKTASEATAANDKASTEVLAVLKDHIDPHNTQDKALATGGYVERTTQHDSATNQNYCIKTFKKTNTLTLRSSKVDGFSVDFARIQDLLYGMDLEPSEGILDKPNTHLEMSAPSPLLYPEHRAKMQKEAIALAVTEAIGKFESAVAHAGVKKYEIIEYRESNTYHPMPRPERALARASADNSAPVEFDSLWVSSEVQVDFEY